MRTLNIFMNNVRRFRQASGMSQELLAEKTGLHQTYISDLERGLRNPSLKTIEKVANALDVPPAMLLAPEGDKENGK